MAKGARWRVTGLQNFQAKATAYEEALADAGEIATTEAAKAGAEEMRRAAMASGTGWEGRGPGQPRSSNPTRNGSMIESITYDKDARRGSSRGSGRLSRSARFGWINTYHKYFGYQNTGFTNVNKNSENRGKTWITGDGGFTEAMGAYEQGYDAARDVFKRLIEKYTYQAWRKR